MPKITLKVAKGHEERSIAFGGNGARPMRMRSQEELLQLAILGRRSNDKSIINAFEDLPSLQDLLNASAGDLIDAVKATADNESGKTDPPKK